jgi:hypothetical protein|tara:strand:+ start:224 stop:415 length:192 start_codon:yes stop_codon:yes gene_type:complete
MTQQIYKWNDEKIKWHFPQFPPPGKTVQKVKGAKVAPKSSPATSLKGEGKEKSEALDGGEKKL